MTTSADLTEVFAERLLDILNNGALALMTSIGHRTGLFDTLAELPPATSQQIADAAGLNERYVREWLGAMVTGRFITYDTEQDTYFLPREYAAVLTRAASPDNIAAFAQYIPLLGTVEDPIIDCFYDGGGVPYAQFKRFHPVMAEDSGQTTVSALTEYVLPLVPGLMDDLKQGIQVLDLGCGSGRALNTMAKLFPNSRFRGIDLSESAITTAREESQYRPLSNIQFEVQDATFFDAPEQYDLITTFDAIHDQAHPDIVLKNIYRALRPDGIYLMQDIRATTNVAGNMDHPAAPFLYTVSCMHCMTVSLAQGGMGLGAMWGEEKALSMLKDAGFTQVTIKQLDHDFQNNYYIVQKD
ncbi:class I SAM-dependent methyltransferase [Leptothoe sp. LEGE 181152]|nr:class I SAM-dependent methyltransferase [Leptothoe sp. LEGE 181152]